MTLGRLVSSNGQAAREDSPSYSEFMAKVDEGDVKEVTLYLSPNSYELQGEYVRPANRKFHVTIPKENSPEITKALRDKAVQLNVKEVRSGDWVLILLNALPLLLLAGFVFFLMRQMQAGGNKALSFGSLARGCSLPSKRKPPLRMWQAATSQGRASGNYRVPQRSPEVPETRRPHSQGRAARRTSRNGQDSSGSRDRR